MKAQFSSHQQPITPCGRGKYYINMNEQVIERTMDDGTTYQEYEYDQILIECEPTYPAVVEGLIRERYSISDELAIQRQRETKPEEFAEYNNFCEYCKSEAREVFNP